MGLRISIKKFESGRGLIAIGTFVLLFYFATLSFIQVSNLLSEIAILEMYENDEPEESANGGEESAGEAEIAPVCDSNSNDYDLDECIILTQEGKVNAQAMQTIWSFFPTAGISLIAIGLHRLRINRENSRV